MLRVTLQSKLPLPKLGLTSPKGNLQTPVGTTSMAARRKKRHCKAPHLPRELDFKAGWLRNPENRRRYH